MRRAAVYGGLIPDTDEGRVRIRFVTEGEASLHACVQNGLAADVLSVRNLPHSHTNFLSYFSHRIHPGMASLLLTQVVAPSISAHMRSEEQIR